MEEVLLMTDKPQAHSQFMAEFPAIAEAYEQLGGAAHQARPQLRDIQLRLQQCF